MTLQPWGSWIFSMERGHKVLQLCSDTTWNCEVLQKLFTKMINFISLFLFDHLSFIRSFALQICKYIREEWVASHNWPNTFFRKIWARQMIWNIVNIFSFLELYERFTLFPSWEKLYPKIVVNIRFVHNWLSFLYTQNGRFKFITKNLVADNWKPKL